MLNVESHPEFIKEFINWEQTREYFEEKQQKIKDNKDILLPLIHSITSEFENSKGDKTNLIKEYLNTDTLELDNLLNVAA